jgi:hypothetical protein
MAAAQLDELNGVIKYTGIYSRRKYKWKSEFAKTAKH